MLVLTRKASEQIQIGDRVVITILRVKGQSVRIGIDAPRDVLVLRTELPRFASPDNKSGSAHSTPQAKTQRGPSLGTRDPGATGEKPPMSGLSPAGRLSTRRLDRGFMLESRDTAHFHAAAVRSSRSR